MTEEEVQTASVVKVARDLTEIERLVDELGGEAEDSSNDRLMPGGKATVSLAPVANLEAWGHRFDSAERLGRDTRYADDQPDDDDWMPVLQTLLYWSEDWRRQHDAEYGKRPTILSEAGFIRWCLPWAWENEPKWDDFAADIRRARVRLEDVVHAGRRQERTRVPCDREGCERKPRLIKIYAPRQECGSRCTECGATSTEPGWDTCPECGAADSAEPVWVSSREDDFFKCPACKAKFNQDDYQRAYGRQLRSEGAERFITTREAIDTLRIQGRGVRTVRKWLAPPKVTHVADRCTDCGADWKPDRYAECPDAECRGDLEPVERCEDPDAVVEGWCEIATHQAFVWWPDLWRKHLSTQKRETRQRSA